MSRFSISNPYLPLFCYPTDHQAVCFLRVQKINCFVNPGRRTFISYVSFEATCYWFESVSQSYRIFTFEIGDIFLLEKSNRATVRRIITKTQQNSHHQSRKGTWILLITLLITHGICPRDCTSALSSFTYLDKVSVYKSYSRDFVPCRPFLAYTCVSSSVSSFRKWLHRAQMGSTG